MGPLAAVLCVWMALGGVGALDPSADPSTPLGPAEQEQGHYLAQLFGLYGENGTLSIAGLARLLHSLGLGRVQGLQLGHSGVAGGRAGPSPGDNATHRPPDSGLRVDVWAGLPLGSPEWRDPEKPPSPGLGLFHRLLLLDHSLSDHLNEDCLNGSQLLVNFGLSPVAPLTPRQFALLCPALLYQIDSRVCLQPPAPARRGDLLSALAQSALAVLALSALAPFSVLLLRVLGSRRLRPLLGFLGALAVGTLCGDALLHLLPHAQGGRHGGDLGPGLAVLGGLFLLFVLENLLGVFRWGGLHQRCCRQTRRDPGIQDPENVCGTTLQPLRADPGNIQMGPDLENAGPAGRNSSTQGLQEPGGPPSPGPLPQRRQGHAHSHGHPGSGNTQVTWMVLLGDGLHNFTDGLAIGVAFSDGFSSGMSTALAVLCHELPHELGDFAMLLQAGLPYRRLLLVSLVSGALGLAGAALGVGLSQGPAPFTPWAFGMTAGVFLYVALVDMLPTLLHPPDPPPTSSVLLQGLGLLLGGCLMLTITLFEEQLLPLPLDG
ncbi:zinc transporter ZIP5 [Gracilinanus agilis]|uniref:zinc transporter ZIP5 n=1 Tax=Gracilinanus agilis TaxID=191870 RepID=UPI001CFC75E5|nr:zinc transporter ZIP5 [Gracilinanus agilis]XP_044533229.1 zinc transporter ZIP5 [Gracilinanus agilis]